MLTSIVHATVHGGRLCGLTTLCGCSDGTTTPSSAPNTTWVTEMVAKAKAAEAAEAAAVHAAAIADAEYAMPWQSRLSAPNAASA